MADRYADALMGLDSEDSYPTEEELAAYGVRAPQYEPFAEEEFQDVSPFGRLLERSSPGLLSAQAPRPRNFGQGLAVGLVQGLGTSGQRIASAREKFQDQQARRRVAYDLDRSRAQRQYESERAAAGRQIGSDKRHAREKANEPSDFVPVPADAPQALKRRADPKGMVRRKDIEDFYPAPSVAKPEKLELGPWGTYMTPSGPKTMRAGKAEALGYVATPNPRATRAASASESNELAARANIVKQVEDIRKTYNKRHVGPVRGKVGGIGEKVGAIDKPGADFRSRVAALKNLVLKARSGGAVTDGEAERLLKEIPDADQPSQVFESRLDVFEGIVRDLDAQKRGFMDASGIDISRYPALAPRATDRTPEGFIPGGAFDRNRPKGP